MSSIIIQYVLLYIVHMQATVVEPLLEATPDVRTPGPLCRVPNYALF